jgi:multimeric flavodoxin WrbA
MSEIYRAFLDAQIVVFASPVYFWTISGPLKTATDRLYAALRNLGYQAFKRKNALLMTAGGSDYSQAVSWYETFERNLGWKNLGEVLGSGKMADVAATLKMRLFWHSRWPEQLVALLSSGNLHFSFSVREREIQI